MVADNHVVPVDRAGGAAGSDDLLQPVGQPLADSQRVGVLVLGEDLSGVVTVQRLDRQLHGGEAADGALGRTAVFRAAAQGDVIAAALGVVGDVGDDGFTGHKKYLSFFFRQIW